jgi:hypothetical protein
LVSETTVPIDFSLCTVCPPNPQNGSYDQTSNRRPGDDLERPVMLYFTGPETSPVNSISGLTAQLTYPLAHDSPPLLSAFGGFFPKFCGLVAYLLHSRTGDVSNTSLLVAGKISHPLLCATESKHCLACGGAELGSVLFQRRRIPLLRQQPIRILCKAWLDRIGRVGIKARDI